MRTLPELLLHDRCILLLLGNDTFYFSTSQMCAPAGRSHNSQLQSCSIQTVVLCRAVFFHIYRVYMNLQHVILRIV